MRAGRFVVDRSLEGLARRLRILGYDVAVRADARLEDLCRAARADGRTVITTSRRVPRACAFVPRLIVPREDLAAAVRAVAAAFAAGASPFHRCSRCNALLEEAPALAAEARAAGEVPPGARDERRCPACGRWYWHGSHVDRLREWFEGTLGGAAPTGRA